MLIDSKIKLNQVEADRIAADVEAWIAKGNKVKEIPIGESHDSGLRFMRSKDRTRLVAVDDSADGAE